MKKMLCLLYTMFVASALWGVTAAKVQIVYTNKMVGDKKTWVADDTKISVGSEVTAIIINKLNEPHGFEIPGLVKPLVIEGNSHQAVTFKVDKKSDYQVKCQLHPAHVGTTLQAK